MEVTIEQIDTPSAPEALLRELSDYVDLIETEEMPGDPPTPWKMRVADWRNSQATYPAKRWALREDGAIRAYGLAGYDLSQNLENGFARIHVHSEHRNRGLGRLIAEPVFADLEAASRIRVDTWIKSEDQAEAFAEKLGLAPVYGEKRSRLLVSDLDLGLMRSWIEQASERATDYELRYLASPIPQELDETFCDLTLVMNTAPREDFEADDEVLTPEDWREMQQNVIDSRCELHNLIAVHKPTGDFVGYTQIKTQELQPDLAWQWDTGVHPEHRNKGLGRWPKAEMIERIVADYPDVTRVDTFNAGSNAPMLAINVAMGFKPIHLSRVWQGDLDKARVNLAI